VAKKEKVDLKNIKGRSFTTPIGRLAFPALFKPKAYQEGSKEYYQTSILFDKETDLSDMRREIKLAAAEAFGKDPKTWPKIEMPWRDGDQKEDLAGYAGCWYVSAKSLRKVKIVDGQKQPVTDEEEVYGGRYARIAVRAKLVPNGSSYFVSLYLQAVQVRTVSGDKGDSFAGGVDVDSAFDAEDEVDDDLSFNGDDELDATL
jgi:hypothetical protein